MATTTINWNLSGNKYVHAQLGDDLNGTGTKDRPYQSLYRALTDGGTIIAMGIFSENLEMWKNVEIRADSFGAAIFDGKRLSVSITLCTSAPVFPLALQAWAPTSTSAALRAVVRFWSIARR